MHAQRIASLVNTRGAASVHLRPALAWDALPRCVFYASKRVVTTGGGPTLCDLDARICGGRPRGSRVAAPRVRSGGPPTLHSSNGAFLRPRSRRCVPPFFSPNNSFPRRKGGNGTSCTSTRPLQGRVSKATHASGNIFCICVHVFGQAEVAPTDAREHLGLATEGATSPKDVHRPCPCPN